MRVNGDPNVWTYQKSVSNGDKSVHESHASCGPTPGVKGSFPELQNLIFRSSVTRLGLATCSVTEVVHRRACGTSVTPSSYRGSCSEAHN